MIMTGDMIRGEIFLFYAQEDTSARLNKIGYISGDCFGRFTPSP